MLTANEETKQKRKDVSPERLGGWQTGKVPLLQVLTLLSLQMKMLKIKQAIRKDTLVSPLLVKRRERFNEEDRVRITTFATC